jgi:hypothetical protein
MHRVRRNALFRTLQTLSLVVMLALVGGCGGSDEPLSKKAAAQSTGDGDHLAVLRHFSAV